VKTDKNIHMKKYILTALIIASSLTVLFAQDDAKAKGILDEVSKKTKAYTSIKADFTITNQPADKNKKADTQNGSLLLKGDKYKLQIKGQEVISDNKKIWTYLKDANEVQINDVDPKADDALNPSKIFTLYEKGYKYKYSKEDVLDAKPVHVIDLFPANPDKAKFHTAKLFVDKTDKRIVSVKMMMKDGSTVTYSIKTFESNQPVADNSFMFDAKAHPGVEVVNLGD